MTRRVSQRLGLPLARYAGCLRQVASHCAKADVRYLALADMLFPIQDVAASEEVEQEQIEAATDRTENAEQTEADFVEPLIVSAPKDTLRQLQYLLQYGELPKTANELGQEHFMESVAQDLLHRPDDYRRYLRSAAGRELERKRMARLFPSHLLSKVWPLLLPADHAMAALCLNVLQEAMRQVFPVSLPERWRWIGAEELLRTISQPQSRRWDSAVYLRAGIQRVGEEQSQNSVALLAALRAAACHKRNDIQEKLRSAIDRVERETVAIPAGRADLSGRPAQKTPWVHPEHKARELPAGEPFYIGNAGSVLLWPFLGRYFQMLGLLEKDAFRDVHDQSRAVYLLQYLASGQMEAPEHELLLNKILCGVKTGEPLESFHALTDGEQQLSEQLLYGVTQNWEKLRNTSILGLRQSFLLREGRLQRKDDAWSLTVSTKTYDALLDSLPWRLSMVRLPWMETILYVKWR